MSVFLLVYTSLLRSFFVLILLLVGLLVAALLVLLVYVGGVLLLVAYFCLARPWALSVDSLLLCLCAALL